MAEVLYVVRPAFLDYAQCRAAYSCLMALITRWERGHLEAPTLTYFGHTVMYTPGAGETLLRAHWNFTMRGLMNTGAWAPGSSTTRIGLVWDTGTGGDTPTPISQPDADWLDLQLATWESQLVLSGTGDFFCEFHTRTGKDFDTKSMRKQVTVGPAYNLSLSWETATATDTVPFFGYGVSGCWSLLIGTPPA